MHYFNTIKYFFVFTNLCCLSLFLSASKPALGFDLKPEEIRGKATDNPVRVLHNRYFQKQYRPELGFALGSLLNESYTDTSSIGLRFSLFLTEWFGIETGYFRTTVKDSDDRKVLNKMRYRKLESNVVVSPDPEINAIHNMLDLNATLAPFYGKLNFVDKVIIYTDLYLTGGISKVSTDQGGINALSFGIGERFYWKKSLSFRVDFKDRVYSESRAGKKSQKHCYSIDFGMSYFFM